MYEVVLVVQWLRELIRWQTFEIRRGPRFWARRSVCCCAGEEEMEGKDLKGGRMQPAREKGGGADLSQEDVDLVVSSSYHSIELR